MKVIIATNNNDKAKEIEEILDIYNWQYFTLKDLNIKSDPKENGSNFQENAYIKASEAKKAAQQQGFTNYAFLADDSGLCVNALDGAPGLYSARFADTKDHKANYKDNNQKLLYMLKDVPTEDRTAFFQTDISLILPDGKEIYSTGRCYGRIAEDYMGTGGFGYDPIFCPKVFNYKTSMAQLPPGGKSKISHRGNALRALKKEITSKNA